MIVIASAIAAEWLHPGLGVPVGAIILTFKFMES